MAALKYRMLLLLGYVHIRCTRVASRASSTYTKLRCGLSVMSWGEEPSQRQGAQWRSSTTVNLWIMREVRILRVYEYTLCTSRSSCPCVSPIPTTNLAITAIVSSIPITPSQAFATLLAAGTEYVIWEAAVSSFYITWKPRQLGCSGFTFVFP